MGSISLGTVFVAGRKRVPNPATGITAFMIFIASRCHTCGGRTRPRARNERPGDEVRRSPGELPWRGPVERHARVDDIFRVKDEKEAIKLANDSPYGLGGSVITKDIERGKRVARQIETGMVFINRATWTAPDLPFGGVKNSGYGRELSDLGISEFVNKKLIRVT
jgi:hypothetical protein